MDFEKAPEGNIFTSHAGSLLPRPRVVSPTDALTMGFFGSSSKLDYDPNKYLYVHTTVVPSTKLENNGFHIKPGYEFSNTWSDSIPEAVLDYFSPTFGISHVYLEHVHIPALRKGRVVDHHLYRQDIGDAKNVLVADALLAVETKHGDLIKMILDKDIYAVSQGCFSDHLKCSRCGHVAARLEDACDHVRNEGNTFFRDKQGTKRLVTNLLGDTNRDTSFAFFDVSLVLRPAFFMAVFQNVLNHNVDELRDKAMASSSLLSSFFDFFGSSQGQPMARRVPLNRPGEIPVEECFAAYDQARGARNPYAAYAKALYARHGEVFVASDAKYLSLVSLLSSVSRAAQAGVQVMKLSDKVRAAHVAAKSYLSSTGAGPEKRDQFVSTLLRLPQAQFEAECAKYTSAEAVGDEKAPKVDYTSGKGKDPVEKTGDLSKETAATLKASPQQHKAGKVMSGAEKAVAADGKVAECKATNEPIKPPEPATSGAEKAVSQGAMGIRGSDDKKPETASSGEEKKPEAASSAAPVAPEAVAADDKKDDKKPEAASSAAPAAPKAKAAEAIADEKAEYQTIEGQGSVTEPTFNLDAAISSAFGSQEGEPEAEGGEKSEDYEITVDVDPEKKTEALAEFENWLAENASDPANPSEEDLRNAIQYVDKKFGPAVIAAALLQADEVAEKGEPEGEVTGEGEAVEQAEEAKEESAGEEEAEKPAEGESAEAIGDEKAETQTADTIKGEELPGQADAPAVHLGDETQNARGAAAPSISGDDGFTASAENATLDDIFESAEDLLSAFGVIAGPAQVPAPAAPKALATSRTPHTSSAKPAPASAAPVATPKRNTARLPMLSSRRAPAAEPTGDMLFENAFNLEGE